MVAWLSQRITGLVLLILIPWKIYSGYALAGRVPRIPGLLSRHVLTTLDGLILVAVIFHITYGLRVVLVDLGFKQEKLLFYAATLLGVFLSLISLYYIYWR